MNMIKVATELVQYYRLTRQVGHTTAMLNGAKNAVRTIILAHDMNFATFLAKQCPNVVPISLGGIMKLRGRRKPLLIDNAAMAQILDGLLKEISELNKEISALRGVLIESAGR